MKKSDMSMGAVRRTRARRAGPAALAVLTMIASLLVAVSTSAPAIGDTAPVDPNEPETVSSDGLPTVQVNGVVWSQAIVGDRVYVTGDFTQARPAGAAPGVNETARSHILAYDLNTGELITSWAPSLNAQGMAITASEDGSRIFVAGDFSQVNGEWRNRVAALDPQTGAVVDGWDPTANTRVSALAVMGDTLYMGGHFTTVGGQSRTRLAAVNATTGTLLPWAPSADRDVATMVGHPGSGRVFVGGSFHQLNDLAQPGMGSLDGTTGAVMQFDANTVIKNQGASSYISSLTTDGDRIFGVGWAFFAGGADANFEGIFSADPITGALDWVNGCRGDNYGIAVTGDVLYTVGHPHDCGMVDFLPQSQPWTWQRAVATDKRGSARGLYNAHGPPSVWQPFRGRPAAESLHWLPTLATGSHTGTNQGAFAVAANDDYVVLGGEFPRVNGQTQQGLVRFTKKQNAPNQQGPLGVVAPDVTPLGPGEVRVGWTGHWDRDNQRLTYEVLRGPTTGTSTVLTSFTADTNWWTRPPLGFVDTTAPPGSTQTYRVRVVDPFGNGGSSAGTTVTIPSGSSPTSTYRESVLTNGADHHWRMGESSGQTARDRGGSNDLALNGAQRGGSGALLNESNSSASWSETTNTSTVRGVSPWWQKGPQTFSVEAWVRTGSINGGKIIGFGNSRTGRSSSNLTDRHIYMTDTGEFRFGLRPDYGERRTISSAPLHNNLQWHHVVATLDDKNGARLYVDGELVDEDASLTKAQVYWGHWRVAGDRLTSWPSAPSTEAFAGSIDEVAVYPTALSLGQVRANYLASGRSGSWTNQSPEASFIHDTDNLTASFDASGSSDPDGTIASYAWDFGDGATGDGVNAEHTYANAGTYTVTLTVTDNAGATDEVSHEVTVTEPAPGDVFAADEFGRTVGNGFGSADVGGPWSLQGASSSFSVSGGAGRIAGVVGANRGAYLTEVAQADVDVSADLSLDVDASGGGSYVSVFGRRVSNGNDYNLLVRYTPNGEVIAYLRRSVGGSTTVLDWTPLSSTVSPGDVLQARLQVSGTDTTQVRVKMWPESQAEPQDWLLSDSHTTPAALQSPGHVGVLQYVSGSWAGTAPTLSIDNYRAEPLPVD